MTLCRRQAGLKAKRNGEGFETIFDYSCRSHGVSVTRIPDSCKQFRRKIIRVKSPFDWVISYSGKSAVIDTKCLSSAKHLVPSKVVEHQHRELLNHQIAGVMAGYVIYFTELDEVVFYGAFGMERLIYGIPYLPGDVIPLGAMEDFDPAEIFRLGYPWPGRESSASLARAGGSKVWSGRA